MRGRRRGFRSDDEAPQEPPADDVPQADPAPEATQQQATSASDAALAWQCWDPMLWRRGPTPG